MKTSLLSKATILLTICLNLVSCKEEEFYEKGYIETLSDQYELDKEKILKAKKNCENAQEANQISSRIVTVNFPAAIECNFNETGVDVSDLNEDQNGPRLNQAIRAKVRQDFKIDIPAEDTVCDIEFDFPNQQMQYDDEIFLLLNDYVIISSQNYSQSDKHPNGLYINDWGLQEFNWLGDNALYDLHYDWDYTPKYCLGVSSDDPNYNEKCSIPKTETTGEMKLDIPKEEIIKIGVLSNSQEEETNKELNFSFVTTGDNDNGDCEHAAYSFEVEVKYIN